MAAQESQSGFEYFSIIICLWQQGEVRLFLIQPQHSARCKVCFVFFTLFIVVFPLLIIETLLVWQAVNFTT